MTLLKLMTALASLVSLFFIIKKTSLSIFDKENRKKAIIGVIISSIATIVLGLFSEKIIAVAAHAFILTTNVLEFKKLK